MNYSNAIKTLKEEAAKNPALNSVLHVFAMRQRSRGRLTATALRRTMAKEHFQHTAEEYAQVLACLAKVGFGTLEKTPKGNIRAIRDVKVTFKSIGMLVGGQEAVKPFRPRKRFVNLAKGVKVAAMPVAAPAPEAITTASMVGLRVNLAVTVNGKTIDMPVPAGMNAQDLAALMAKFQAVA